VPQGHLYKPCIPWCFQVFHLLSNFQPWDSSARMLRSRVHLLFNIDACRVISYSCVPVHGEVAILS
jgi:hypothetical protein